LPVNAARKRVTQLPIKLTAGSRGPGTALPIARARILIDDTILSKPVKPNDLSSTFEINLKPGRKLLHTWFDDKNNESITGAYYVYVRRK